MSNGSGNTYPKSSDLFHPDNINSKDSNKRIEKIGGYEGLERILKTNRKVNSFLNIDRYYRNSRRQGFKTSEIRK